jgi:hypothetical protein
MRIDINLAKEPFHNHALYWVVLAVAYVVATVALLTVLAKAGEVGADTAVKREEIAKQEAQIKELNARIDAFREEESRAVFAPQDRVALDDARKLINRKAFSWSKLLSELEPHVPPNTKVSEIGIESVEGEGANRVVTLSLTCHGTDIEQMSIMLANFDRSGGRFLADPIMNGPGKDTSDFEFQIAVRYRPGGIVAQGAPANG